MGIQLAKDFPSQHVIIEGDWLSIVKLLNEYECSPPWCIKTMIQDSRRTLKSFNNIIISYVSRASNKAAHCMTAIADRNHINQTWNHS